MTFPTLGHLAGIAVALGVAAGCNRSDSSTPRPTGVVTPDAATSRRLTTRPAPVAEVVDPTCGMPVPVRPSTPHAVVGGRTYYFCGDDCRDAFVHRNPADAATATPTATQP